MVALALETIDNSTIELVSLEELFENSNLKCPGWETADKLASAENCQNEATHVVRCKCGAGAVPICERCLAYVERKSRRVRRWHRGQDMGIWFRGHCEHIRDFRECIVLPI